MHSKMSFRRAATSLMPRILRATAGEGSTLVRALRCATSLPAASCAPAASLLLARGIRSSCAAHASLSDAVRDEIEYEKQNYTQPEELATGPPAPFTLTETQGDTLLTLTRTFADGETINVDLMAGDQPEEEAYEDESGVVDVDVGVVFNVQVVKGDDSLVFECKSDGSYLQILHVSLEPADGDYEDSLYTGPVYDELDEAVQSQFMAYLEQRGITPELGAYLLRAQHDKEQREYTHWLERVHAFVTRAA